MVWCQRLVGVELWCKRWGCKPYKPNDDDDDNNDVGVDDDVGRGVRGWSS